MDLGNIVHQCFDLYLKRFGSTALPEQIKALKCISNCRTHESGELYVEGPDCSHGEWRLLSCGNRHCPKCLNHQTSTWLDKQQYRLIPVGGIDKRLCRWIKVQKEYLFNSFAMATMFRGTFLDQIQSAGLPIPDVLPDKWVAHCEHMGNGMPALEYLPRYLYRGVISENNIVENRDGYITFRYRDSTTGEIRLRKIKG